MTARTAECHRRRLASALVVLLAFGCGDVQGPEGDPADAPGAAPAPREPGVSPSSPEAGSLLPDLIVSDPPGSAVKGIVLHGSVAAGVVYTSLPPGSVPNGERIVIATRGTEAETRAELRDGGFDPVAVTAEAGDTLDVRLFLNGEPEPVDYVSVVPERRSPVLVRIDPPEGRRDVPLNAVLLLVFSEPMDSATVTASAVQLTRDGAPVAGSLAFGDAAHLTVTFTPAEPLAAAASYTLSATQALQDLDSEPLGAPASVTFTTRSQASFVAGTYERMTPHADPGTHSRYVFHADGTFDLQYETATRGSLDYSGVLAGSDAFLLKFDDSNQAGPWEATGRLEGDLFSVEYNTVMQLADFEDGVYLRDAGAASGSGLTGTLSFVSARDGSRDIYAIDVDGGNLRRLTTDPGLDEAPTWSPDGSRIAFSSDRGTARGVYVMAPDGSGVTRLVDGLTPADGIHEVAWAPDGARVTFTTLVDGQFAIGTVDDGGRVAYLVTDPGVNVQAAWSPDGRQLAFVSDWEAYDFVYNIYTMNADGTDRRLRTTGFAFWPEVPWFLHPDWSPDGSMIAYVYGTIFGNANMRFNVAVMSADGSIAYDLAWAGDFPWFGGDLQDPGSLSWSPDGRYIAYTFYDCDLMLGTGCPKARSVRYVSFDGTERGTLIEDAESPSWGP